MDEAASQALSDLFDDDVVASKQSSGLKWILASGLLLILALGGWWGYTTWQRRMTTAMPVTTATPSRETLENRVDVSGQVTLGNQQTLIAPEDATVEEVLVNEGEAVTAGEVLLRLRARELEIQLDQQSIEATKLDISYQRQQEVLQERLRDVQRAEERLAESRELLDQGYISEDEYERDRSSLESAQSELRTAQIDLQKAELDRQKSQSTIANLRARLADNSIVSPINAVVLDIPVADGDGIDRKGDLITLGDPDREMVQFELMPLDAGKVSVNMPVRVSVIGPNPEQYPGRVVRIDLQAVSNDSNSGQAAVAALAQLDQPSGVLIPGGAVNIAIILTQETDALAIPLTALQQDEDGPYVWVVNDDNQVERQSVTTGLETLDAVEITNGIDETDTVITAPPPGEALTEGMAVEPAESAMPPE
jgi:HlyD family secretion protein